MIMITAIFAPDTRSRGWELAGQGGQSQTAGQQTDRRIQRGWYQFDQHPARKTSQ